jgi:hypothetical protein
MSASPSIATELMLCRELTRSARSSHSCDGFGVAQSKPFKLPDRPLQSGTAITTQALTAT